MKRPSLVEAVKSLLDEQSLGVRKALGEVKTVFKSKFCIKLFAYLWEIVCRIFL